MTKKEAEDAGINPDDAWLYVRVDAGDKPNLAPPAKAQWLYAESVSLGNGGDIIGVPVQWEFPDMDARLDLLLDGARRDIARLLGDAEWAADRRAKFAPWVGEPIAEALDMNLSIGMEIQIVRDAIKKLCADGKLVEIECKGSQGRVSKGFRHVKQARKAK